MEAAAALMLMRMSTNKKRRFMSVKENHVQCDVVLFLPDKLGIVALTTELTHSGSAVSRLTGGHAFNINLVGAAQQLNGAGQQR